jgi:hypothetical protein
LQRFGTETWLVAVLFLAACSNGTQEQAPGKYDRKLTVVVTEATVYQRPDSLSRRVGAVQFGQQVLGITKRTIGTPEGWDEIEAGNTLFGFVRSSSLGDAALLEKLRQLQASIEGVNPQASGITTAATWLRLDPGRHGQGVEKLAAGTQLEMFARQAILRELPSPTPALVGTPRATPKPTAARKPTPKPSSESAEDADAKKEIWYKVRLADGRVGYVYTANLRFDPPPDIEQYTRFRRTVAWQKLRTVDAGALGSVGEYLVAYGTPGIDFGADFNRIEIYTWDGRAYGTLYARSGMQGILPIRVSQEANELFIELRELDPKQAGKLIVRRYQFPRMKEVSKTSADGDGFLH